MLGAAAAGYFGYRALDPAPERTPPVAVTADAKQAPPPPVAAEPVRRPIPEVLPDIAREDRDGVDFRDEALQYADKIGLDYPLLIGEDEGLAAAGAFGMDLVLPFSIFADRHGRIVTLKVGELHADEAGFILDTMRDVG
jgi:hypothetical protein